MESLSYTLEGRDLPLIDDVELDLGINSVVRGRNVLELWDAEKLSVIRDEFEAVGSEESGLLGLAGTSILSSTQCFDVTDDVHSSKSRIEIGSGVSNSGVGISGSSLVDTVLKVTMPVAPLEKGDRLSVVGKSMSFPHDPAKRARIANLQPRMPVCLVHGCDKDLSCLKEYHRRHKVCDVHSRTPVVIVNSVKQRFCQQCSRFHKLAEFDEGKRSCRKRLADHNERRRKPQFDARFGSTLLDVGLSRASLLFSKPINGSSVVWQYNESSSCIRAVEMDKDPPERGRQYPSNTCPNSSHAPSLLSAKSQSAFSSPRVIPVDLPQLFQGHRDDANLAFTQNSTQRITPEESSSLNLKSFSHPKQGTNTINLLQLSLRLQQVIEQQKLHSALESGTSCHLPTV